MITKEELAGRLAEIIKRAESRNFHIGQDEVRQFFPEEDLSEEQIKLVYDYLLAKKVVVEGYLKEASGENGAGEESGLSEADRRYVEEYKEMLAAVEPERPGERARLFRELAGGERPARDRLSELLLPEVLQEARDFLVEEILLSDLVQEGSLCLLTALEGLQGKTEMEPDAAEKRVMQEIRQGMQALAEQQKDVKSRDRRMVGRVQELKDNVEVLKDEMGRKVYLDELADFMNITEEEAEAILKLAGEEVPREE